MPRSITGYVDDREVQRWLERLGRNFPKPCARAMNKAVAKVKTAAVREIATEANVQPQRLIRKRMKTIRARPVRLRAGLAFLLRPVPAILLSGVRDTRVTGRGKRKGTGVKARGRSWPHAFIAAPKQRLDKPHVFQRRGPSRLPLEAIKIPVADIAERVLQARIGEATKNLVAILPHEVLFEAEKRV